MRRILILLDERGTIYFNPAPSLTTQPSLVSHETFQASFATVHEYIFSTSSAADSFCTQVTEAFNAIQNDDDTSLPAYGTKFLWQIYATEVPLTA